MADGKVAQWFKNTFSRTKVPEGPTAAQLYQGPAAFGEYRPAMAQASGNQQAETAALDALRSISQRGQRTGITPEARGQFNAYLRRAGADAAAQREGQLQGLQARGLSSGGAAFATSLNNAGNAAADAAAQMAVEADRDRYGAQQTAAQLGSSLDAQRFAQDAATRSAIDDFNRWASEQSSQAQQVAYGNAQQAAADRRKIWERIGAAGANFANSWIQNQGDD